MGSTHRSTPGNACVNAWVPWHDTFFLADAEFLDEEIIDLMYYIVEKFKKKVNPVFTCFMRNTPFPVSFAVRAALECLRGGRWPAIGIQRLAVNSLDVHPFSTFLYRSWQVGF